MIPDFTGGLNVRSNWRPEQNRRAKPRTTAPVRWPLTTTAIRVKPFLAILFISVAVVVILLSQRGPAAPVKLADLRNFPHTGLPRATACYAIDLRCLYRGFERPIVGEAVHQRCDQLNRSAFHTLASALKE